MLEQDDAVAELWFTLTGVDEECCSDEDDDGDGGRTGEPGYEKDAAQRQADCRRVHDLLVGGISPNLRSRHRGASLLWHALEYDHRHGVQMIKVVVECGADVNLQTHAHSEELPLDCELWLEGDGPYAVANAQKRAYLVAYGARHSIARSAQAAADAADAADAAADEVAKRQAADAMLDRRLTEARNQWLGSRVPTWDDDVS